MKWKHPVALVVFLAILLAITLMGSIPVFADSPTRAVALIFHHVSEETPAVTSISPVAFEEILDLLTGDPSYSVLPLATVVDSLQRGGLLPPRSVTLTFDDGYESVYSEAFPRLKRHGFPFTVFICPSAIDARTGPVMTWDQLREMADAGATIANHSSSHVHLQRRRIGESAPEWKTRIRRDLLDAERRITEELGSAPGWLAFPYGEYDIAVLELVDELGWAGFGQQSGPMGTDSDFRILPRFPIGGKFTDKRDLALKLATVPFPLRESVPVSPLVGAGTDIPVLRLNLGPGDYQADQVAAFASGQGPADVFWVDKEAGILEVRARQPLSLGRNRYNITIPSRGREYWYWYSQLWIVGDEHETGR
ncbi:MAG: polysaccharide deacetylase family protein [Gemmatimonadales bacterium]|nr:polysaccharide deacetylase family protein [Gemmatimonadales bacterium]